MASFPSGSWDTHVHIFDSSVGPFASSRAYTPAQATLSDLVRFSASLSLDLRPSNFILVQPSPYHTDNTVLLASLKRLQQDEHCLARGIAVVDLSNTTDEELWRMHQLGIRGLRLNMNFDGRSVSGDSLRDLINAAASRIQHLPEWKLQLFCSASVWDEIYETILHLPVQVIADHVGGLLGPSKYKTNEADALAGPTSQKGYNSLVRLAEKSKVFIKISGLYRLSSQTDSGYHDLEPIIRALASKVPNSLIWGSDWPHTGEGSNRLNKNLDQVEEFRQIDNRLLLENVRRWVGSEETWTNMMIHTPKLVYH